MQMRSHIYSNRRHMRIVRRAYAAAATAAADIRKHCFGPEPEHQLPNVETT